MAKFKNPVGFFKENGPFEVELTEETHSRKLPDGVVQVGNKVSFPKSGTVSQSMGGIQFSCNGADISWSYKVLKVIRRPNGKLIWRNRNYSKMEEKK